jgi:hypothetical protein
MGDRWIRVFSTCPPFEPGRAFALAAREVPAAEVERES